MELRHIDIAKLTVSAANMRSKGKPDIANILPSVRARGILVPLMVRPNGSAETFEIVAGKRRFHAALAVAQENGGECEPLACAVLDDADDAAALEASPTVVTLISCGPAAGAAGAAATAGAGAPC